MELKELIGQKIVAVYEGMYDDNISRGKCVELQNGIVLQADRDGEFVVRKKGDVERLPDLR